MPKISSVLQLFMPMITNGTKWYNALLYQLGQTDVLAPAHQMMVVAHPFLQSLLCFCLEEEHCRKLLAVLSLVVTK